MAKSKFTASVVITVIHPEGTKVTKKAIKQQIEDCLFETGLAQGEDMEIIKVRVRDVDTD